MDHALTPRSPRLTRRFLGAVGSVALMLGVYLAAALPVAACDCMGLEPMASYAVYSSDFFDGAHYVLKGASPVTGRELVRPSFRNWFRPNYPYVYAKFRVVW